MAAAFLVSFCPSYAQNGNWGAKTDMLLRNTWSASSQQGGTTLSSVVSSPGHARVIVVFDGDPVSLPGFRIVGGAAGSVAAGIVDLEYLPQIASSSSVRYIRSTRRYYPNDDPGVLSVRSPRVRTRQGLTGKGVLLGIIDSGIDWDHPDFLDSLGNTRIEAILDLSETVDSLKPGELGVAGPYGGIAVYRDMIDAALDGNGTIRQKDFMGHGTHVAGTAAASPSSDDTLNSLGGVAPGVSIVAVKATSTPADSSFDDYNIFAGTAFLDSLAWHLDMPYVLNLSLGSTIGSHDGNDALELNLDQFVRHPYKGRAIVVSAGNSRTDKTHAEGDFFSDSTVLELSLPNGAGRADYAYTQIWLSNINPGLSLKVYSPEGELRCRVADGDTLTRETDAGIVIAANAFGGIDQLSGDKLIEVLLADKGGTNLDTTSGNTQLTAGTWRLVMFSSTGSWDAYLANNYGFDCKYVNHVTETGTVAIPGTGERLITVGAYTVRTGWESLSGGAGSNGINLGDYKPGELAFFSSVGPTRDGRMKPELTAPGQWVMGPLSGDAWPLTEKLSIFSSPYISNPLMFVAADSIHAVSRGTSFSSPHVAGVVALLLEANPNLSNTEIRYLLSSTASTDSQSVSAPDNYWGYGRVNAMRAVAQLLGLENGSVMFSSELEPSDTLTSDSLQYSVKVNLGSSFETLTGCRLSISWPPDALALHAEPDSTACAGALGIVADTDSLASGVLNVQLTARGYLPDEYDLLNLAFRPVTSANPDSVMVNYEVKQIDGDLSGDLLRMVSGSQSGPLSLRVEGVGTLSGDLDESGKVDIFDVLELLQVLSGRSESTFWTDVNGSGSTDIFDLLWLLQQLKSE